MDKDVFQLLDSRLLHELTDLGFQQPTPIQIQGIPKVLSGESVLLVAPTGHGKTEAAFLPLLHRLLTEFRSPRGVDILWITPLRALNRDILRRLVLIAERLDVRVEVRHGDTSPSKRRRQTLEPPQLFITTPETLQALLTGKRIREHLRNIKCVIIDEIHELAASKRGAQLMVALERLQELTGSAFQRVGLSATIANPQEITEYMGGGTDCEIIESPAIKDYQFRVEYCPFTYNKPDESPLDGPVNHIWKLINEHQSTLIFCNERQTAEALALRLTKLYGSTYGVHHGSLSREARIESELKFKEGRIPFLVCTSSLELGLDIGAVDLVIQFGSPRQVVRLIQRVGRSGHQMDQKSNGVIITSRFDDICESLVIAQRALAGQLEIPPMHYNPLDILAHQLVGLAIEYKTIPYQHAIQIIKRATTFRDLDSSTIHQVIDSLKREGLISRDEENLRPRRKSYAYYFENLSVIPDIPYHRVINVATGRPIGRIDTGFAEEYGRTGNILVLRGRPWEVVKQDDSQVYVTAISYTKGRIPRWSGELIPVAKDVIREVGHLWLEVKEHLRQEELINFGVPLNTEGKTLLSKTMEKQHLERFVPSVDNIIIEVGHELVVIHSCYGTRINETLGRLLAAIITSQLGIEVAFHADQYRILFRFERGGGHSVGDVIYEGILNLNPEHIEELLELVLLRSPYFARRFLHIARRFGIISRDANLRSTQLIRMMQYFTGTPIIKETLREFFVEKLDLNGTFELLKKIHGQTIKFEKLHRKRPSPFARQILARFGEFLEPETPEAYIIEQTRKRLENRRVRLVCLHCGEWSSVRTIKHLHEHPHCQNCESRLLAGVFPTEELLEKVIRLRRAGKKLTPEERKTLRKGRENADVILNYGKKAIIAMAGKGIGPTVAKRVLADTHDRSETEFYKRILESEKQFIRTREWWADAKPK